MRKRRILPLQEILADDITIVQDYVENAFSMFMDQFLDVSSGVIRGLAVTSGGVSTVNIATGYIYQNTVYGELEASSGVNIPLTGSGSRTDLIVASYFEALDQSVTGKVLVSVDTGQISTQAAAKRRLGAILIERLNNTTTVPAGKIALAQVTVNTSTITSIVDVRSFTRIRRLQADMQLNFLNMFYAGF
jgi:hypothetical protein